MIKKISILFIGIYFFCLTGCVGYGLPHLMKIPPLNLARGGDQLGRDVLANRLLVANKLAPIKNMHKNEVLNLLGEPQQIEITTSDVSEDWHYIYYKRYKTWPTTDKGLFLVRFYHEKVIDVVKS